MAANEVDSLKDWARFPGSRGRTQAGIILANVALFDALQAAHKGATPVAAYARGNAILAANIGEHTGVVRGYENYAFAMTLGEHGLLATAGVLNPETHELITPTEGIQRDEIIAVPNSQSAIPIFK